MKKYNSPIKRISAWYFSKRVLPYWAVLFADTAIIFGSAIFVYWLSNRTQITIDNHVPLFCSALLYAALGWIGARLFRTYSGVIRYSSFVDLLKLAYCNALTLTLSLGAYLLAKWQGFTYFSALNAIDTLVTMLLATLLMWLGRVSVKIMYDIVNSDSGAMRVFVYGALSGGVGTAKYMRSETPRRFELRGFISREEKMKHMKLMDVPVYTVEEDLIPLMRKERVQGVVVTPRSVNEFRDDTKLQDLLIENGIKIFLTDEVQEATVKNGELQEGTESLQIKEVSVEDLLPRSEIKVDLKSVRQQLQGKKILITGSAGSIGSEIVRQVAQFAPAKMLLLDQAETPQHDVQLMMKKDFPQVPCEVIVANICRKHRMESLFESFRPDYVFHAAAYKHVPMMEDNPTEAVLNNIYGTKIIADLSAKYGVKKFVMISTDKAVNPTNVMGCSKRICEIYVQSLDRKLKLEALESMKIPGIVLPIVGRPEYTQFVTTRFGNVLGSTGSVIPLFREQIKNGGPVTVTDERIVRYFMLIPEACKLVLEAGTKGNGGEIFVFDMGKPVKIASLAKRMIALSGAKNVEIKYTGLREGEKLYEEVLNEEESTKPTFHPKIRIAQVRQYNFDEVSKAIDELVAISKEYDDMATVRKMKEIVPEFRSNNSRFEILDAERSEEHPASQEIQE